MTPPSRRFDYNRDGVLEWRYDPPDVRAMDTGSPTFDIPNFRAYDDDAAPDSATALVAENVALKVGDGGGADVAFAVNFLIRFQHNETNLGDPGQDTYNIRFRINGGTDTALTSSSTGLQLSLSSNFADGDAVASGLLTAPGGTQIDGEAHESTASDSINYAQNGFTEQAICVQCIEADLSDLDAIQVGVDRAGSGVVWSANCITIDKVGGIVVSPAPVGSIATVVAPLIVLGSLVLTPAVIGSIATTVDPTVVLGSLVITPTPASTIAGTVDPLVVGHLKRTSEGLLAVYIANDGTDPFVATDWEIQKGMSSIAVDGGSGRLELSPTSIAYVRHSGTGASSRSKRMVQHVAEVPITTGADYPGGGGHMETGAGGDDIVTAILVTVNDGGGAGFAVEERDDDSTISATNGSLPYKSKATQYRVSLFLDGFAATGFDFDQSETVNNTCDNLSSGHAGLSTCCSTEPAWYHEWWDTKDRNIACVNLPTGYKLKVLDSSETVLKSATESSGTATLDMIDVSLPAVFRIAVTDASDVNVKFFYGGSGSYIVGGDFYDYAFKPSVSITPTPAESIATTVDPTVVKGSLVLSPPAVGSIATVVDPTVINVVLLTPTPASTIATTVDPTVVLGSLVLTPTPADTIATTVDPTVVLGSLVITPTAVGTIATVVDPIVRHTGRTLDEGFEGTGYENTGWVENQKPPGLGELDPDAATSGIDGAPSSWESQAFRSFTQNTNDTGYAKAPLKQPDLISRARCEVIHEVNNWFINNEIAYFLVGFGPIGTARWRLAFLLESSQLKVRSEFLADGSIWSVSSTTTVTSDQLVRIEALWDAENNVFEAVLDGVVIQSGSLTGGSAGQEITHIAAGFGSSTGNEKQITAHIDNVTVDVGPSIVVFPIEVGTIATTVDPIVLLGNLVLTPTPAGTIAETVDPTVINVVLLTPTPASTIATTVDPTVLAGSLVLGPPPASTIATVVDPTVLLGSLVLAPTPADTIATTVDPTVVIGGGGIVVTPPAVGSIATVVDPTVVLGSLVLTPTPADTIATTVDPTVVKGSLVLSPPAVGSIATVVDPTVLAGSLVLAPTPAGTIADTIDPTVINVVLLTPPAIGTIATTIDPTVLVGSLVIAPTPATTIATTIDPAVVISGGTIPDPGSFIYAAGFDDHGDDAGDVERYDTWGAMDWFSTGGKFGGGYIRSTTGTNNFVKIVSSVARSAGRVSFYWKRALDADVNSEFFIVGGNGLLHFWIECGNSDRKTGPTDNQIILLNEDDTLLGTSINTFTGSQASPGPWLHCECEWGLGAGTGYFKLWVDSGSGAVLEIDVSGLTLGNSGSLDDWRFIRHDGPQGFLAGGDSSRLDDMVVQDINGTRLLVGHRIWNGNPDSDISTQFTPSAGGDNFAMVDDTDPDQDATYVESTGAGQRDIYGAAAPTITGTIVAVTIKALTRRASGSGDIKLGAQVGGDLLLSDAISPDGTLWFEQSVTMVERPAGGVWTQTDLDNLEPVIEATATGVRVTMVWFEVLTVTFTFPGQPVLTISDVRDVTAVLTTGTFVPGEGGTHQATQWQVTLSTDGGFATPVYDSGESVSLLLADTATGLTADIDYIARVRQQESNDVWSPWSVVQAFTTDGPPAQPTITFGSAEGDHIVWNGSTYVAGTGGTPHENSQWQVTLSTDTGFASPIIDYTTAAPSELETYTAFGITPFLLQYIARVRYQDENGIFSPWSDASSASPLVGTGQFYTAFAERPLGTDPSIDPVADWEEIIAADGSSTWVLTERNDATCRVVSRREQVSGDGNSIDPVFWQGFPSVGEMIVFSRIIFDLTGTGGHTCVGDGSPDGLICRISIGKLDEETFDNLDEWRVVRSGLGEWKLAPDRGALHGVGSEQAGNQALLYQTGSNPPNNPNALIVWDGAGNQAVGSWVQVTARKTNFSSQWWLAPVPGLAFALTASDDGYATVNVHQCGLFPTWVFQTHYSLFAGLTPHTMFRNVSTLVGSTLSLNHHYESYEYVKAAITSAGVLQSYLARSGRWGPEHEGRLSFDTQFDQPGKVGLSVLACTQDDHDGDADILFDNVTICSANTVEVQQLPEGWELRIETPTQISSTWPKVTGLAGEPNVEIDFKGNAWPAVTLSLFDAEGDLVVSWDPPGGIWGGDAYLVNAGGIGVGKLGGPAARLSSNEPADFLDLESSGELELESTGSLELE